MTLFKDVLTTMPLHACTHACTIRGLLQFNARLIWEHRWHHVTFRGMVSAVEDTHSPLLLPVTTTWATLQERHPTVYMTTPTNNSIRPSASFTATASQLLRSMC